MLNSIFKRRSVRKFIDKDIKEEDIRTILRAGMAGPSCTNRRQWSFIVIKDKETLSKMVEATSPHAALLKGANMGILVCGDATRFSPNSPLYWTVDCSIACENMVLGAHELGIGTCWLGIWPKEERIKGLVDLFNLPETAIPHSIIAFGYPDGDLDKAQELPIEEDRIHIEKW